MEARKRILGDVTFEDPEDEGGSENDGLSPAEILKQKVAQAVKQEGGGGGGSSQDGTSDEGKNGNGSGSGGDDECSSGGAKAKGKSKAKSKGKKNRERFKTPNPESPRDFPISKTESERILRQPRGPDGTTGFALQR
jgi:hypothetical protein